MPTAGAVMPALCQNCGAPLSGPFCKTCGQREQSHIVSLGHLLSEAVGDIYNLDSRLWRTLKLLLIRPGQLTVEFLAGRRASYVPPFRLYLVVSILLFLLAHQLPRLEDAIITFDDPQAMQQALAATQAALEAKRAEFERIGGDEKQQADVDRLTLRLETLKTAIAAGNSPDKGCKDVTFTIFDSHMLESRVRAACVKIVADNGTSLTRNFFNNLPKLMFVLLPILALVNKALYLRARRYYVEHLLFFVHVHVFLFLVLCAIIIGNGLFALVPGGVHPPGIVSFAVCIAMLAYVYLAMRRVYGQGRFKTFIKFSLLLVAYAISLTVTTLIGALYSALTL
jgi:hypothetical protein